MTGHMIGYARASTNEQDLTTQRNGLRALGVSEDLIYVDNGLTGTNRAPRSLGRVPGLWLRAKCGYLRVSPD